MKFSLIVVHGSDSYDGKVDGNWVQDHIGTLESATVVARETEAANQNKITVAVVDELPGSSARLEYWTGRVRLDRR